MRLRNPILPCTIPCVALAASAAAFAPDEAAIQGFYEGVAKDAAGEKKLEVRVVASGKRTYKVFIRQDLGGGEVGKVELNGKTEGERVVFRGLAGDTEWEGVYAGGEIRGRIGRRGKLELKRVERKSPTLGERPPIGAVVLLDGRNFSEMVRRGGANWYVDDMSRDGWAVWEVPIRAIVARQPAEWPGEGNVIPEGWVLSGDRRRVDTVLGIGEDGSIQVPRGGMNSRAVFEGSFDLHVEFMCPLLANRRGQGRGNSGVYLPCGTEIQVLDSFGVTTYKGGGCGGLYRWKDPDVFDEFNLASYPPLAWQTYDVEYRGPKDENGKPTVRLTVYHNGIKIHDDVKLTKKPRKGNFHFQDHGNPVRYRNIWVLPVKDR